ncbi:MAG: FtsX-like permease family protein [Cytophagales bacterium]|nr:MAG: FtsX-like permease family protein [Cytophagales bacterium]
MNLASISFSYLKANRMSTALNLLLLAFGVSVVVILLLVVNQVEDRFSRNAKDISLVVGAKGSPLQLILSAIYHIDYPTGNIKIKDARKVMKNPLVKQAIPLGLGDSYNGFRIVGTNHDYFKHFNCQLKEGKLWEKTLEAVIGSDVAKISGLKIGDKFAGAHGLEDGGHVHESHDYVVVGIMQPNGMVTDKLVLTAMESVWAVHEEKKEETQAANTDSTATNDDDKEYTALLIKYRSPMGAVTLPRLVNSIGNLQAASPAVEISRLFNLIGIGADILRFFALAIICISFLSMFGVLYNALKERQFDIALMRTLGASRLKVFVLIIFEGVLLAVLGTCLGIVLGHSGIALFASFYKQAESQISAVVWLSEEFYLIGLAIFAGFLSAFIPALQAYKMDIAKILAK